MCSALYLYTRFDNNGFNNNGLCVCRPPQAFQGTGRTLAGGSGSTSAAAGSSSAAALPVATSSEGEWRGVDEGKPTTSLQLRLADGSRLVSIALLVGVCSTMLRISCHCKSKEGNS